MGFDRCRALELLRLGSQLPLATFREGQEYAIQHVVDGRGRLLLIRKTGWGKSIVYFIAAKTLREQGEGPTLLISPLLALMRNHIAAAQRMGLRAVTLHSENREDWEKIEAAIRVDAVDVLLISPERLANDHFRAHVLAEIAPYVGLLVIDEAHCISDWGHDFRPHYRLIERMVRSLPPNLRLLATTATANDRVMQDLTEVLGPGLHVSRGDLHRPSLLLQTIRLPSKAERLGWLAEHVSSLPGSGIIYTLTRHDAEQIAEWLRSRGLKVEAYTGDTGERRAHLEQALLDNRLKALVATSALGMGFDKPDLAFVIHYQCPGSVVAYYQQVGRAGRGIEAAYGVLLGGAEDSKINDFFINSAFPAREEVMAVLEALEGAPQGLSVPALLTEVNLSKSRIEKALALLSLEAPAPVVREGSRWQLTPATVEKVFWDRAQRLTDLRRAERTQMQDYLALASGHMAFLIRALDGDGTGLTAPELPPLRTTPDEELVHQAALFLQKYLVPVELRKRWPHGGLPRYGVRGSVEPALHAGRALCYWGDSDWGEVVRRGKYRDGRFSDELVAACRDLVTTWSPEPFPTWVTCIPSLRHPDLVPDFSERLARQLMLPFEAVLRRTEERPEQKRMENSVQQARNVDGTLELRAGEVRPDPVLLVDDMVDSRWTLTVAAWLLRSRGSGPVWPIALAQTGAGQ